MLICEGQDYAHRGEEDGGDGESEEEPVPGKVDGVVGDYEDADGEHGDEC